MKKYVDPKLEFITLSTNDAITNSYTNSYGGVDGDCYGYDNFGLDL